MSDDPFSDVKHYTQGAGSLGGIFEGSEGLGALHAADTRFQPTGHGLLIECTCQQCGMPAGIEASWDELTYISMKMVPPGWFRNPQQGLICPHVGCARCAMILGVGLTPQECERALRGGIDASYITAQQVQQAMAYIRSKPGPQV
jgi:hypothetical protein